MAQAAALWRTAGEQAKAEHDRWYATVRMLGHDGRPPDSDLIFSPDNWPDDLGLARRSVEASLRNELLSDDEVLAHIEAATMRALATTEALASTTEQLVADVRADIASHWRPAHDLDVACKEAGIRLYDVVGRIPGGGPVLAESVARYARWLELARRLASERGEVLLGGHRRIEIVWRYMLGIDTWGGHKLAMERAARGTHDAS